MRRQLFMPACGIIILVGVLGSAWFIYEGRQNNNTWHAAAVIGSLLVAVGWMVTNLNTMRTNEIQHTLKFLAGYHVSPESVRRWEIINEHNPNSTVLEAPGIAVDPPDSLSVSTSIYNVLEEELNECEFIATGVLKGVYDDEMLRHELEPDFFMLYRFAKMFIAYTRQEDKDDLIWSRFTYVCEKWGVNKPLWRQP